MTVAIVAAMMSGRERFRTRTRVPRIPLRKAGIEATVRMRSGFTASSA